MSVERSIYTRQPAMSGRQLKALAISEGFELRFLETAGMLPVADANLDDSMLGKSFVLIGWTDSESTDAVETALRDANKAEVDRLGRDGKLGWCTLGCRAFDFAKFEAALREEFDEDDEDLEPMPTEIRERMSQAKTQYSFRAATRPAQCADLLSTVADLIRHASDGFEDE